MTNEEKPITRIWISQSCLDSNRLSRSMWRRLLADIEKYNVRLLQRKPNTEAGNGLIVNKSFVPFCPNLTQK